MPSDAARPSDRPAPIRLPDQLQQARGSDPVQPVGTAESRDEPTDGAGEPAPRREGILGQLETECGHD